jgi:SET domain-containing protein
MEFDSDFLKSLKAESYVSPKVERKNTVGKGAALFAKEKISKDEIVSISGGIILKVDNWKEKLKKFDYSYNITEDFVIAPLNPKDPSDDWRMNHCCEPNCGVKGQIIFVALRDIEINEELTFDYAMTESDPDYCLDLHCEKINCRNKFSGNDWKNKQIQDKYKGYFSYYLEQKINKSNNG